MPSEMRTGLRVKTGVIAATATEADIEDTDAVLLTPLRKSPSSVQQPHARAERSCRVCRARVAASQGAHVLMEDVFGDQDRYAQRADQIAQRQTGEICSRHTDTTFSYEVVLIP